MRRWHSCTAALAALATLAAAPAAAEPPTPYIVAMAQHLVQDRLMTSARAHHHIEFDNAFVYSQPRKTLWVVVGGYVSDQNNFNSFTAAVLLYSLKGGLRSSIFTDVIQAVVFVLFLGLVLAWIVPSHGPVALLSEGRFALDAGADLLLVALLQVLSYPFHDPVLTDRAFITREKTMLRAFGVAGVLGFLAILAFSLVGVHARLEGIATGSNVPAEVARALGVTGFFAMSVVMISSAASTLDSTFTSLSKSVAHELPLLAGRTPGTRAIRNGVVTMALFALLGNLPMMAGTDILKATTLSGTMVIGLAPVFLLSRHVRYSPLSFHLSFWTGMTLGVLLAVGALPASWAIGDGKYAMLLGTNLYGLLMCTAGFLLPLAFGHRRSAAASTA